MHYNILFVCTSWSVIVVSEHPVQVCCIHYSGHTQLTFIYIFHTGTDCLFVCLSSTSLCHSNGHIETMPAREINPFTALTRIRSQFLRTQWSTSNHSEWTRLRFRPLSHRGWHTGTDCENILANIVCDTEHTKSSADLHLFDHIN